MRRDARLDAVERRTRSARAALAGRGGDDFAPFATYRDDPAGMAARCWPRHPSATRRSDGTAYQTAILGSVAANPATAVISGHGVGKTATIAQATVWWLLTRPMSRVVICAPQFERQVRGVVFAEIRRWVRRSVVPMPLEVLAGRVVVSGHGPEWGASGIPATEPERIEGVHGDHVLLILDETKGVPQDVFDALQGTLTGHGDTRLLVCSTPGGVQGPFWRVVTRGPELGWTVFAIPSTDSSLVSEAWCEARAREWGVGSPLYESRVLGRFADAGDGVLFPLSMLEAAVGRELPDAAEASVVLGVDVARSVNGDANCVAACRGGKLVGLHLWREPDAMKTVARVAHLVAQYGPSRTRVDEAGVGAGVVDRLREMGVPVEGVNFGAGAAEPKRFRQRRSELFWGLRAAMEAGRVSLPDDDELLADLSALRYEFTAAGQIQLESKDAVRSRLGRSPDRGDALALAVGASDRIAARWVVHRKAL
ncbi:MAG: hypothetical protein R2910_02485 [Gemmatimonadales bacterium]